MLDAPRATRPIKFVAAIRARSPTNTSMSKSMPLPMKNGWGLVTCPRVIDALADGGEDRAAGYEEADDGDEAQRSPRLGNALDQIQDVVPGDGYLLDDPRHHLFLFNRGGVGESKERHGGEGEGKGGEKGPRYAMPAAM